MLGEIRQQERDAEEKHHDADANHRIAIGKPRPQRRRCRARGSRHAACGTHHADGARLARAAFAHRRSRRRQDVGRRIGDRSRSKLRDGFFRLRRAGGWRAAFHCRRQGQRNPGPHERGLERGDTLLRGSDVPRVRLPSRAERRLREPARRTTGRGWAQRRRLSGGRER